MAELAKRLPPEEAARTSGQATRTLLETLAKVRKDDSMFRYALASSLSVLAERLPPPKATQVSAKAMQTLLDVLDKTTDPTTLSQLVPPVEKMAEQLAPEESAAALRRILNLLVAISEPITRAALDKAAGKLAQRCGKRDQIELLKHPFCVGAAQDALRAALERRFHQHFAAHWKLIAWLGQHHPDLDLISPPRRSSREGKSVSGE